MEELLKYILVNLCDQKDSIKIDKNEEGDSFITFNLEVAEEDKGRVIGKGGQNIKAIRSLLTIIGIKENKKVLVKVL
jgi:predicted RNA-binding protein YlqC (UPF0109 family)